MATFTGTESGEVLPSLLLGPVQALGNDTVNAGGGNDIVAGWSGDDVLAGGAGADVIIGGILSVTGGIGGIQLSGFDTANYSASAEGVAVDLSDTGDIDIDLLGISLGLTGATTGHGGDAEGDSLVGITHLTGSAQADFLGGNSAENTLTGGDGNDNLRGAEGADVLDGGAGANDMADYNTSDAAVTVNLVTGTGTGGDAAGDSLTDIEWVRGSAFNDTLTGNDGDNRLSGLAGTDTITGGDGHDQLIGGAGADVLNGDAGFDTALYDNAAAGVTASLFNTAANTGDAASDRYQSVENLVGSSFNDVLIGDGRNNYLVGWRGDDRLSGGGGIDYLDGGLGADTFAYGYFRESTVGASDRINDFSQSQGDTISLSPITGGNGSFIGSAAFSGTANEVRAEVDGTETHVFVDVDGNGAADMGIRLLGAITLTADDFVL
ncbi:hypothetical protein KXR53_06955 [Inquilinus limosus]|uniref:calcium-binding protein n=1 Tax=Inquilinus limosus TaxID=171674 RepID=UPI003F15EBB0